MSVCSTGRQLKPRSVSLRWREAQEHTLRWRCRRPSRRACMCTSESDHPCRRKWRLRPLTSHTVASTSGHGRRVARIGLPVRLPRVPLHQRRGGHAPSTTCNLWRDNRLPRSLKLRLYAASVCATLTHGSEAWMLTPRALATLNGFNSRQLHRITGRSYREEATKPSDGCANAEASVAGPYPADAWRPPSAQGQQTGPPYQPGSLLMDTPLPLTELIMRAADRRGWARDS